MVIPKRSNTILYCRRWKETVCFYRETLNLAVSFENDWFVEFQVAQHAFVSVADAARASVEDVRGQGVTLSWQVDDLDQTKSELERLGVPTGTTGQIWHAASFYIRDPEGHRIEFWQPLT